MKITRENKEGFHPITVSITIETKEEFEAISGICQVNISIPEAVCIHKGNNKYYNQIQKFLRMLDSAIKK